MRVCGTEDEVHERRREAAQGRRGDAGHESGHPHGVTPDTVFFEHLCTMKVVTGYFWICLDIFVITGTFAALDWPRNSQKCAPGIVYEVRVSLDTFWAP